MSRDRSRLYPVMMCGGSGTRLWPESRPARPKQFLPLIGPRSMFQQTMLRIAGIGDAEEPIVVGGARHGVTLRRQLAEIGVRARFVAEPVPRDSAPAIAAAALLIAETDPDGIAIVVASDHHISDAAAFQAAAAEAAAAARRGLIVTLGVRPTAASTAYGYIRPAPSDDAVAPVDAFIEKPDAANAAAFVEAGYLWNSGNFIFAVSTMLEELERYAPALLPPVRAAIADARREADAIYLDARFGGAPKISIDYAVMEHSRRAAVLPVDFAWSDLGAWDAVWAAAEKDAQGNAIAGAPVVVDGARDCILRNLTGGTLAVIGARRLAVIVEPDAVLICDLDRSQAVKAAAERAAQAKIDAGSSLVDYARRLSDWLRCAALPVWWALGADHANGGFHEVLADDGTAPACARRMRVSARQAWVYAEAAAAGWPGPWIQAADHGLFALDRRYRRPDGLYRTLIGPDGSALDDTALLYDQAFVLLALAARGRAGGEPSAARKARALLEALRAAYAHSMGGFRENAGAFLSNPLMHLLEACLAWAECTDDPRWDETAAGIVALVQDRLIDRAGGFIRENYQADWSPAEGPAGRVVEPGHQFEWAWLLRRWSRRHGEAVAAKAAHRLFAAGAAGIDPSHGAVVDQLDDRLKPRGGRARLWPQTEHLKAALVLAQAGSASGGPGPDYYLRHAEIAASTLCRYLDKPIRGLWHDKLLEDGTFLTEGAPASSLYHLAAAIRQLAAFAADDEGHSVDALAL